VVALNRAVAVSYDDGPAVALPLLDQLADDPRLAGSPALSGARADVRRRLGQHAEAAVLYRKALEEVRTEPERTVFVRRLAEVSGRDDRRG
jgi:RNA polymerase sigma-70 factor (ECF subfamily)